MIKNISAKQMDVSLSLIRDFEKKLWNSTYRQKIKLLFKQKFIIVVSELF